ncbi:nitrilase [Blattamonas nauphoetae]|uniref:Nitrilase n=1 Tax=Blattamonas nauphoetae TaxID=2049346 RepID=A0ABQ9Y0P7_9EUKA|nr:nitrilase [Blattamonas nauphoetae]
MRVVLIQMNIVWQNPQHNKEHITSFITDYFTKNADHHVPTLFILPEMFSTGFAVDLTVEPQEDGSALPFMQDVAAQFSIALAGSVVWKTKDQYFNRFFFVRPDRSFDSYDKRHLFTYGGEQHRFTAGNKRVITVWEGVRFLLQICYDLRFPVFARNKHDYDVIIYVSNWPTPRLSACRTLLQARAIENVCYVLGVNRVGTDPKCSYSGGTMAVDYKGQIIVEAAENQEDVVTTILDLDQLRSYRDHFPALDDADKFEIEFD